MTRLSNLVDLASDAAFAVDGQLHVVAWNSAATKMLGYALTEVIYRRCHEVLQAILPGGGPLCGPQCHFGPCFGRCQPFAIPTGLARHRDGRWVPLSFSTLIAPRRHRTKLPGDAVAIVFFKPLDFPQHAQSRDQALRVSLLGHFCVALAGRNLAVDAWTRRAAITALKYLAAHAGSAIHRDRLIEALWTEVDEPRGRERLKVTIYFLRRQLQAAGFPREMIETHGEAYMLRREGVWIDAVAFERLAVDGSALLRKQRWDESLRGFEDALALYRGDYLEEDAYADWCAEERERLREIYFDVLAGLVQIYRHHGKFDAASHICRVALVRDPCREAFHRLLMECLFLSGQADRALAQFHHCQRILARELGVEPLPETKKLYNEILNRQSASETATENAARPDWRPIVPLEPQVQKSRRVS